MYFVKQYTVYGRQARYKFVSKSSKGIFLNAIKYRDNPEYSGITFAKKAFATQGIKIDGWDDHFIVREDCEFNFPHTPEPVPVKKDTLFLHSKMQELRPDEDPLVELQIGNGSVVLNYDEWRTLRFEMDEMFLLQKKIPE